MGERFWSPFSGRSEPTDFLKERDGFDFYADDPFLQSLVRHYAGSDANVIHERLLQFSKQVSFRWRDLAEVNALPENSPRLEHYDGHGNRIDRIVRPRETEILEQEIRTCLGLLGVQSFGELEPAHLHPASPVALPHVTSAFPLVEEGY